MGDLILAVDQESVDVSYAAEARLVRRASRGDSDAFAALIRPHDRPLRALAYRLLEDASAMDDALQDAYVKAFVALPVRRAVRRLPDRQRRVVELRFGFDGEPQSLEAIARKLAVSRERVRELEGRGAGHARARARAVVDEGALAA